ncbi:MAG: site-specific integrase [Chloroflexi bacterium]|nr:site-specific integrase [Chloroflexota bacterium]
MCSKLSPGGAEGRLTGAASGESKGCTDVWVQRFLDYLAVVPSTNTVRAYAFDLRRWARFCQKFEDLTKPDAAKGLAEIIRSGPSRSFSRR